MNGMPADVTSGNCRTGHARPKGRSSLRGGRGGRDKVTAAQCGKAMQHLEVRDSTSPL